MSFNQRTRDALEKAKVDMLAWKTMMRARRGDTLLTDGKFEQMVTALNDRAEYLENDPNSLIEDENDLLALALFAEDRGRFFERYFALRDERSMIYTRAQLWLPEMVNAELEAYLADQELTNAGD